MFLLLKNCTCEGIDVTMVTNKISQLQESSPAQAQGWFFWKFIHNISHYHFNWTILQFPKWIKKNFVLCENIVSIYTINRIFYGCLEIRILSFRALSWEVSETSVIYLLKSQSKRTSWQPVNYRWIFDDVIIYNLPL